MITDSGVSELCKCSNLELIDISGVISEASIEKLGQMSKLQTLILRTNLVDDVAKKRLQEKLGRLRFHLVETPQSLIGKDGFHRTVPKKGRSTFDALEGTTLESMLGPALTDGLRTQLGGKVVVVEFWGTWCGPCLSFVPELERLQSRLDAASQPGFNGRFGKNAVRPHKYSRRVEQSPQCKLTD